MNSLPFVLRVSIVFFFLLFHQQTYAQTVQDLEIKIEQREQEIETLEKQITRNNTSGNTADNAALKQKKEGYEKEIKSLLNQIKLLESGVNVSGGDCELEVMAYKKEIEATEAIVDKLEQENLELNKEIQRLTIQGGGEKEIERLKKKVTTQNKEINVLKGQIKGYQRRASSPNSSTASNNSSLERKIEQLEREKARLKQQLKNNTSSRRSSYGVEHDFQKQFIEQNSTNVLFGYRYTLLPKLNYEESSTVYQGSQPVGTLISTPNQQVAGHNAYIGIERLWHGASVGGNIGLAATYSYNFQSDMIYNIVGGQFGGELTILPIRMGIRISGTGGYVWGKINNHSMVLKDGRIENDPDFNTMIWGWETKLRIYVSRMLAFTGSIGADYPISEDWEMNFWGTSMKFGLGVDVLISTTR